MQEIQSDGATLREHLTVAWNATGRQPDKLRNAPVLPEFAEYPWECFKRLRRRCRRGEPITYHDMMSFFTAQGFVPSLYDIQLIESFDNACIDRFGADK